MTSYEYFALFIWSILEGEIGLMLAGWLASKKIVFNYANIIVIASLGALIGDIITFSIGKFFKKFALSWLNKYKKKKGEGTKLDKKV